MVALFTETYSDEITFYCWLLNPSIISWASNFWVTRMYTNSLLVRKTRLQDDISVTRLAGMLEKLPHAKAS